MKTLTSILIGLVALSSACATTHGQKKFENVDLEKASKAFYSKLLKRGCLANQPDGSKPVIIIGKPSIISLAGPSKIPAQDKLSEIISRPFKEKCVVITNLQKFKGSEHAPYSLSVNISENTVQGATSKMPVSSAMFRLVNIWNGTVEWQELYSFEARADKPSSGLSAKDFTLAADKLANALIAKSAPNDKNQVLGFSGFSNRTTQVLQSDLIAHVLMKLVQSDKFAVSAFFNSNQHHNDPLIREVRKVSNNVPPRRLKAPTISLRGSVIQAAPIINKESVEVTYSFSLILQNVQSGLPAGSVAYNITKIYKK